MDCGKTMNLCLHRLHILFSIALLAVCTSVRQSMAAEGFPNTAGTVVDFNPDNGRSDIRTKLAHNWVIQPGKSSEFKLGTLQARITTTEDGVGGLAWGWWKAGYDHGSTISSDGVVTQRSGR
jgi:hypothetical protein